MRTVAMRYFQQHLHEELRNLPVTVTRLGKPWFVVSDVTTFSNVTTSNVTTFNRGLNDATHINGMLICEHGLPGKLCKKCGRLLKYQ